MKRDIPIPWERYSEGQIEDLVAALLLRLHPGARRMDGAGGDDGIDVLFPVTGGIHVYEIKSFRKRLTKDQKRQVEDSARTAAKKNSDMRAWTLVLPLDHHPPERRWLDTTVKALLDVEVDWIGVTRLNVELAAHPDLVRAYAPGAVEQRALELLVAHLGDPFAGLGSERHEEGRYVQGSTAAFGAATTLAGALEAKSPPARRSTIERLAAELESVHGDYLKMFECILQCAPEPWERSSADFADRMRATTDTLRQLRLVYEPVRVRLHALAQALDRASLPEPEHAFVAVALAYFPVGELRVDGEGGDLRTSGTAVLDHLYRSLDGDLAINMSTLIRETLAFHRRQWSAVCEAYAAMAATREAGG